MRAPVSVLVISLIALVLGFVGSMPLAGPVSVMVVSRGAVGHYAEAVKLAIGASIGEGVYAGLAFWGFASLLERFPAAMPISRALTGIVLIAVGIHFVRWTPKEEGERKKESGRGAFLLGLTTSLVNPTLLVTWSAVATGIYSRQIVPMTSLLAVPFGIAAAAGIAGWNIVLVALLRRYRDRFPKSLVTWFIRGMGVLLILIGAWSGVSLARAYF